MGDDYESLAKDMLHELNLIICDEMKIGKKLKKLIALIGVWNKRKLYINEIYGDK